MSFCFDAFFLGNAGVVAGGRSRSLAMNSADAALLSPSAHFAEDAQSAEVQCLQSRSDGRGKSLERQWRTGPLKILKNIWVSSQNKLCFKHLQLLFL